MTKLLSFLLLTGWIVSPPASCVQLLLFMNIAEAAKTRGERGGGKKLSMRECNNGEYLTQLQTGIQAQFHQE